MFTGLAVVGERDYFGSAHLTLLPLEILGLTLLAGRFFTSRTVAWIVVAGCAVDVSMGVGAARANPTPGQTTRSTLSFTGLSFANGQFLIGAPGPDCFER